MASIQSLRKTVSAGTAVLIIIIISFSESYWSVNHPLTGDLLFALGLFLAAIAAMGRIWCAVYIEGYKTKTIITSGPYSMCRNPLYLFSLLGAIGIGLSTQTLSLPTIMVVGFILYYRPVIKNEEIHLEKLHPTEFKAYKAQTPAYCPILSKLTEPSTYNVNPKRIKKELLSAIWFLWVIAIIQMLKAFQREGVLPSLLEIY